ncbi:MAG: hypothetical protein PQJ59_14740 [Spirochaetales bacterium]|nr:hypothetical protein [Spirochaetales bacterium]
MKSLKIIAALSVFILWASCSTTTGVSESWMSPEGLNTTESVYFDGESGVIYVSNINGKPTERNGAGFISRLKADGTADPLEWVGGMDAPKGMGLYDGRLYVSDINRIHVVDVTAAAIVNTIEVEGAKFLNDIAIDERGTVYFSDTGASKIGVLVNGAAETWLELTEYKKPNGLFMDGVELLAGTSAGLVRISLEDKSQTLEIPLKGGIDGLKPLGDGSYVVSDWKGKIQIISAASEPVVVSDTTEVNINAADFEYVEANNGLLVPTFFDNRVIYLGLD